jgi:hypothetical protein
MEQAELIRHVVSLLDRITRAERYAAAMHSQEARLRFLAIAAELQHELDLIQDGPADTAVARPPVHQSTPADSGEVQKENPPVHG